jgi:hypothetical protein
LNIDTILDVFGKTKADLEAIGYTNSYHPKVTQITLENLEKAVELGKRFKNWNEMLAYFMTEGHTLRADFNDDPAPFFNNHKKGLFR